MTTSPGTTESTQTPAAAAPAAGPQSIGDVFSLRVQVSLFLLILAFLGWMGWRTWQPATANERRAPEIANAKIDLNRADRTELLLLHGVGPELADRIIDHREKNGPFEGLHELRKVPGIGPATLERLRPYVALSWPDRGVPNETPRPPSTSIIPAALKSKADESVLDPNHATLAELDTLPGIGPKLAQRIVDQRTQKPFVDVGDLRRVPGIGPKILEKIKPRLRIGDGTSARLQ